MKVRKLELADCGGFVRFETGKMLNLLNYAMAAFMAAQIIQNVNIS